MGSFFMFIFFKQKTAYEMRISDWSSDVCSSDLPVTTRLPADSSLSNMPPPWPACEPSPNTVSICTAASLYISAPASEIALSPGSSSISTRSEEHTSELQSLMRISYAVFCLKKTRNNTKRTRQEMNVKHVTK